ncbi:MAG: O-antigen ligase family protein [Pyrinomonadaceae bacterium]
MENFDVEGYRVKGSIGGMFGNPNDMALHLVTMLPIAVGLFLSTRNVAKKLVLVTCLALYLIAIVVTLSRGGFLGLMCVTAFLGWKISRRNRPAVILLIILGACAFLALAPGEYSNRLASIGNFSLDPNGSAGARQALLIRSILVTLSNPIFGVGFEIFTPFPSMNR